MARYHAPCPGSLQSPPGGHRWRFINLHPSPVITLLGRQAETLFPNTCRLDWARIKIERATFHPPTAAAGIDFCPENTYDLWNGRWLPCSKMLPRDLAMLHHVTHHWERRLLCQGQEEKRNSCHLPSSLQCLLRFVAPLCAHCSHCFYKYPRNSPCMPGLVPIQGNPDQMRTFPIDNIL